MFYTINEEIIKVSKENNLSCGDMLVLSYILSFTSNNQECKPSLETISENTLMSKRNVCRSIKKLEELNLINIKTKKGIGNIYTSNKMLQLNNLTSDKMSPDHRQNVTTTSDKMSHNNTSDITSINKKKNIKKKKSFDNYSTSNIMTNEDRNYASNFKNLDKFLRIEEI